MKCPACKKETEGRNHNKRGLRCTFCWARLPDELYEQPGLPAQVRPKPKRGPEAGPGAGLGTGKPGMGTDKPRAKQARKPASK